MSTSRAFAGILLAVFAVCLHAASVKNEAPISTPSLGPDSTSDFSCDGRQNGFYADYAHGCHQYYVCIDKGKYTFHCGSNEKFDEVSHTCVSEETIICEEKEHKVSEFDCEGMPDGDYSDRVRHCQQFVRCHGDQQERFHCSPGSAFDETQGVCLNAKLVDCPLPWMSRPTSNGVQPVFDCTDKEDGLYADYVRSCHTYYSCRDGRKETYFCPAGMRFNEQVRQCRPMEEVDCLKPLDKKQIKMKKQIKFRQMEDLLRQLRTLIDTKKEDQ